MLHTTNTNNSIYVCVRYIVYKQIPCTNMSTPFVVLNNLMFTNSACQNSDAEKMRPSRPDLGVIKAVEGQDGCPRCGGAVFAAEQMLARGTVFAIICSI